MTAAFDDARVTLLIGDFASVDASGKLTVVGAGFTITGLAPEGNTPPQHLVATVALPQKHIGSTYTLGLELRSVETDTVVSVPGPSGGPEGLRVQQLVRVDPLNLPPGTQPSPHIPSQNQMMLNFPVGLPLAVGSYQWRLEIDGQSRKGWRAPFTVLGQQTGPIFGGPVGPADLPGVQAPFAARSDVDDDEDDSTPPTT